MYQVKVWEALDNTVLQIITPTSISKLISLVQQWKAISQPILYIQDPETIQLFNSNKKVVYLGKIACYFSSKYFPWDFTHLSQILSHFSKLSAKSSLRISTSCPIILTLILTLFQWWFLRNKKKARCQIWTIMAYQKWATWFVRRRRKKKHETWRVDSSDIFGTVYRISSFISQNIQHWFTFIAAWKHLAFFFFASFLFDKAFLECRLLSIS